MPTLINHVVPWGRNFDEYVSMFNLTSGDLRGRLLGCGDGPASFNMEATQHGFSVTSCDPIYEFSGEQIAQRIDEVHQLIIDEMKLNYHTFRWDRLKSPEEVGRIRLAAMRNFLEDYEVGKQAGRYLAESLPTLSFSDGAFDLALSSHFLFLYSESLSLDFHLDAVREMCRIAHEVRIYPLLALGGTPSPHVEPVIEAFRGAGLQVDLADTSYEFQRGATKMLRIKAPAALDELERRRQTGIHTIQNESSP